MLQVRNIDGGSNLEPSQIDSGIRDLQVPLSVPYLPRNAEGYVRRALEASQLPQPTQIGTADGDGHIGLIQRPQVVGITVKHN